LAFLAAYCAGMAKRCYTTSAPTAMPIWLPTSVEFR